MKHVHVGHDAHIARTANSPPGTVICGWAEIGNGVKIGVNASILPHRKVGDGARIGAGAVVTKDVPAGETWVGNPARRARRAGCRPLPATPRSAAHRMKLYGLISWYDEAPSWLSACVASLAKVGCDHIVALDGAYAFYPEGKPRSGPEQAEAIYRTAEGAGMGCTIHAPSEVWLGNEVEKRSKLFEIAEVISEPNVDWWFVMDADQVVIDPDPSTLKPRLEATDLDVAETMFEERMDPYATKLKAETARKTHWNRTTQFTVRNLFRALPQLRLATNHFTYRTADGRRLWGNAVMGEAALEPALLLHDVRIEHRTWFRDLARHESQYTYYRRREELGIEKGECHFCHLRADKMVPFDFERTEHEGKPAFAAGWVEVCEDCEPELDKRNRARLSYLGYDEEQHGPLQMTAVKQDVRVAA
jgi:hypothetical protein